MNERTTLNYGLWSAILACMLALSAPAHAQESRELEETSADAPRLRFVLPFEVGQGPRFDGAAQGFRWVGQVSVLPGLAYAGLEINSLLDLEYQSPAWDALLGGRVSYAIVPFLQGTVSLRLAVQAAYCVRAINGDGAVGLMGDLASILRLGLWAGRDFEHKAYYALITVGTDVMTWSDPVGAVIAAGPMEDVGDGR